MNAEPRAAIVGTGSVLPDRVVPNRWFESFIDTSDEWIRDRTGIVERRFAVEGQATSDLATEAATIALDTAGIAADQVDLVICATCTPDTPIPSAAVWVQRKLGITAPAFDLNAACAGFSYAISTGAAFIGSGQAETILVIGAEVLSRFMDLSDRTTCVLFGDGAGAVVLRPTDGDGLLGSVLSRFMDLSDRATCVLFGDGAGAVVLRPTDREGLLGSVLGADGTAAEILVIPAGGSSRPATHETVDARDHAIRMPNGREVFKRAVVEMANACRELLEKSGHTPDDVDVLIPHQANARIMIAVAERLGIGMERSIVDVASVGNTSAASIPIALDRAWRAGRVQPGHLVLLTSFGAGLSWGANLLRWTGPAAP